MRLEDQLREAFRRPEGHPWPDERGAFDRFLRRRARRGRAVAAGACLGLVAVLGAASLLPRLLAGREVVPAMRTVRTVRVPSAGFEVPVPAGWTIRTSLVGTRVPMGMVGPGVDPVQLIPQRRGTGATVLVGTAIMSPRQYPGTRPGADPDPTGTVGRDAFELDDAGGPLGQGRRPDGRPYVWRTRLWADQAGAYAIAWPYHCVKTAACPPAAPWRVLVVHGDSPDGDTAVRERVLRVLRFVVDQTRPITNALPGGDPGHVDPIVPPVTGRWLLGTGGGGRAAWEAYVSQNRVEAGFELHFPYRKVKPGRGVHAEDVDAARMLANGELPMLQDCLSWLPEGGVILSGIVPENVVAVRVELEGQDPRRFPTFGTDKPPPWAAYVTAPLPARSRLVRVVALDAQDREVATALPGPFGPQLCRRF
jgi:hypothetical protein